MKRVQFFILALVLLLGVGMTAAQDAAQAAVTPDPSLAGALQVAQVLPADGSSGVSSDALIVVIFNRPVVPLLISEETGNLPNPLTFTPAVGGSGEWVNTSIYQFRPEPGLAGGQSYTIAVDANLTAADGAVLGSPFTWAFSTAAPSITQVIPADLTTGVSLDQTIQITFSAPVDRSSAETAFVLANVNQAMGHPSGAFEWADDSTGFRFTPDEPLAMATTYAAGFPPGQVTAPGGGAPLEGITLISFATVPLPGVLNTDPYDGQQDAYPYSGFTLFFQSPMNPDTLRDRVIIDPEPFGEYDTYYNDYNNSFTLAFTTEPSTEYTVTLEAGMEDVYGNAIEQPTVVQFRTRPFDPDVMLQVPGSVGFYNADNAVTQLFLTHRNVSRVDLELYRVDTQVFLQAATGENSYDPANYYQPDPAALMRSWSILSDTPENQRQYELLNLSDVTNGPITCAGAPESRLQIGDTARVITDAVRVRAVPVDGEVLTVLYQNAVLPVTGGPTCAANYLWWQVTLPDGRSGWAAEGIPDEYYLDVETQSVRTPVDVTDADGSALPPGVYFLHVSTPETTNLGWQPNGHFLIVGNTNITTKTSPNEVLSWVTDVHTGAPMPGAEVTVYTSPLSEVGTATTDADGLAPLPMPRINDLYMPRAVVVDDGVHFGIALSTWSDGIDGYNFNLPTNYSPEPYRVYMYTDRPVYRPNQPVYFRGVAREQNDIRFTPPSLRSIPVQIMDEMGNVVYQQDVPLTPFGTFSDTFMIAADAPLGYYRVAVLMPGEDPDYYGRSGSIGFNVAEYRAPEFQVTVTPEREQVAQGDTIRVGVDARYFFGGIVQNATVDYSIIAQPFYFFLPNGNYSFNDFDYDAGSSEFYASGSGEVATGTGTLDANGQFLIEVPADLQDATQSQSWSVEVTVTDDSGQAVAGRASVIVHKGQVYVGVQPDEYVATAGEETTVSLITVDWDGQPVANQTVDIEVVERRWSSVQETDDAGRAVWTSQVEEIPVSQGTATTGANGEASYAFTPPSGGIFKIRTTVHDGAGNQVISASQIYVSSETYIAWRQQNSYRIDLVADRDSYVVGDTASILITSPFQGNVEALITVERGEVLSTQQVTLTSNSYVVEVPITAEFAPNVFVSVILVKGVDDTNPVASFRAGLVQLAVDPAQREITLDVQPNVEQAGPGDTVTFTIRATDYAGNPVVAELGAGLTDLSVLTLAPSFSSNLLEYFFGQQGLSVRTGTPLTINTDQLTQTVLDVIKGGGGGFGEGGIFDIRQEFVDTAYWNGALTTNADGTASFDVTLPDNLTTWRLDVRAVTSGEDGNMLVGDTTYDLISTKPLLIRPVTPRFFVVGDQAMLAAVVNNNTDTEQTVTVNLSGTGLTLPGATEQTVTIPAGAGQRVEWNATIVETESVDLLFTVQNADGSLTDASKPPLGQGDEHLLPVYRYEVPETVGTGGALLEAGSVTETILLPTSLPVVQGDLRVRVEPSLAATTFASLNALRNAPYQSVEQTVTYLFANVEVFRALNGTPQMTDALRQDISEQIGIGLQRLYAWQKVDGGWGWFSRDDSDPGMTAYALLGLVEARDQGFTVTDDVIRNAINFANSRFIVPSLGLPQWQINRQSLMLFALARANAADNARTANLYENRAMLSIWAKALLAMTVASIDGGNARADVLISDLVSSAAISATGVHWEEAAPDRYNWNTNTRTTAMVLDALVRLTPQSDLIPNVIRWLMAARKADAWETTQETAWATLALTDWSLITGDTTPTYPYSIDLNGTSLASGSAPADPSVPLVDTSIAIDALSASNQLAISREAGNGALYYTAFLRAYLPVDQVEPLNNGIVVERHYTLLGDESRTPITQARAGDQIQVRLTIIAPNNLNFVVVTDPIPAGTDAINPELATSPQVGTQPELSRQNPLDHGWGWWWFGNIEFRDQQVNLYSSYLPAGTYEFVYTIRAGLAGVYNVIPATAQEAYFPEVYGRSAGEVFTILPGE